MFNLPFLAVAGEEDALSLSSSVGAVSLEALDEEIRSCILKASLLKKKLIKKLIRCQDY
jgi:hypothetical protein